MLYILSLCNNPFSFSFRKSGTALPPLVHQIHVCTSTLMHSFILIGVLGGFSEFRSVSIGGEYHLPVPEVCRVQGAPSCQLLLCLPSSAHPTTEAEAETLLTLNIRMFRTRLPTLLLDYRFHGDGEYLLAIFTVTNSNTMMAQSRYSLGAYGN